MPKRVDRVRLDFVVPAEVKRKIEDLSYLDHEKMTKVVCRLIEQEYDRRMLDELPPLDRMQQLEVRFSELERRYSYLEKSLIDAGCYMPF